MITCSKANFNKAAHEKGKRTLNSYIRCKTGREDRPYERTGPLSAHIALEFYDEAKRCSFLVGAVMDSATEEKEPNVAWYLMENRKLQDDLFQKGKQIKGISAFRATNKGITAFAMTITEAKKMMQNRFGRLEDKFFSLIPKALAFKPIHDIKDFVYSYVLDEKDVNIDALKENVRSYQDLERMLQDVKQRIGELESICEKEREVENYIRRDKYQEYFIARAGKERTELERKEAELKDQIKEDKREIKELKRAVTDALSDAEKLLKVKDIDGCILEYRKLLEALEQWESLADVYACLERVIAYKEKMYQKVQEKRAELNVEIRSRMESKAELEHQIRELEAKRLVYPAAVTRLQAAIGDQFRKLNRNGETRVLCELLEIKEEKWQNAVEGFLNTQRFYLLAEPEDFDVALSVYDKLRGQGQVYGVGLINTSKLEGYEESPEGTLAEVVTSKNIWARRYVNMILGKVHRCSRYQDLKKYPVSITMQCMRYQNHVVSAIRPEIYETPYIGAEAYKKQLEQCRNRKEMLDQELSRLNERRDAPPGGKPDHDSETNPSAGAAE